MIYVSKISSGSRRQVTCPEMLYTMIRVDPPTSGSNRAYRHRRSGEKLHFCVHFSFSLFLVYHLKSSVVAPVWWLNETVAFQRYFVKCGLQMTIKLPKQLINCGEGCGEVNQDQSTTKQEGCGEVKQDQSTTKQEGCGEVNQDQSTTKHTP